MTGEPGAEEGGEDIFAMPDNCVKWMCDKAPLINEGKFRVCSNCGASYGEAIDVRADTLYPQEFAALLIDARIPFRVEYPLELQGSFFAHPHYEDLFYKLLVKLRGSKLR
jgi:hypothetical protein